MKILWLTWKDHLHPDAGGAEVVLRELSYRLKDERHEVTWLTCGYNNAPAHEYLNGIEVIRIGSNRYLHSLQGLIYYVTKLRGKFDVVIEVVNTAPYFSVFFAGKSKKFLLYHQLAREIWFYETKPPLSHLGFYVLEPLATRALSKSGASLITVSESTKNDLSRYGFNARRTHIISEGIEIEPLEDFKSVSKYSHPTLLSLGTIRSMKRTLDQIKAFEIAKKKIPTLQLKIAGNATGPYGEKVLDYIKSSKYKDNIEYLGKVSVKQKIKLMQKCHVILQTALKEGWGLTITEAASQGTPAVVYDVDGLRDSVRNNDTGIITHANPQSLATGIVDLLSDVKRYNKIRQSAWQQSKLITFDNSYSQFKEVLELS